MTGMQFGMPTASFTPFTQWGASPFGGQLGASGFGANPYGPQPPQQILQLLQLVPQQLQQLQQLEYVQQQQIQQLLHHVQQLLHLVPGQLAQLQQLIQYVPQQIQQLQQASPQQGLNQIPGGFGATSPWGLTPQIFSPQPGQVM